MGEALPAWHGDRQRASLRGFARLKAILWRRSLWLYQEWKLWGAPWYRPLTRALRRASANLDLFSKARVHGDADHFGETPILTMAHLLALAQACLPEPPSLFVDLGCGRGVTCLTAASLGWSAVGFEKEAAWVGAASRVASELALDARFESGDFLQREWPEVALYLVVATAFPEEMRAQLAPRLSALGRRAAVLTADWELPCDQFERLWGGTLPVEWGMADFALFRVKAP